MSTIEATPKDLSLFVIEEGLAELIAAREEAVEPEEIAAVEQAVREYIEREVRKVDGVRAYYRHAEIMAAAAREEATRQTERARAWENRRDRLKTACQAVMEAHGLKRLEGNTGSLLLKGNGGLAPLNISDDSMVPEECCEYRGTITGELWARTVEQCPWLDQMFAGESVKMERAINNKALREALKRGPVAGAHLDERGQHLEIK